MKQSEIKSDIPYNVGIFADEYFHELNKINSPTKLRVKPVNNNTANEFVLHHHYLKRKIYIARNCSYGIFLPYGQCVGVTMFGFPVWTEYKFLVPPNKAAECPELIRLCTVSGLPKNTESYFLARCFEMFYYDWFRETGCYPKYITSFCDIGYRFNGSIYKATNFVLFGKTSGRPTNPGKSHGKWGVNKFEQQAEKLFYLLPLRGACIPDKHTQAMLL